MPLFRHDSFGLEEAGRVWEAQGKSDTALEGLTAGVGRAPRTPAFPVKAQDKVLWVRKHFRTPNSAQDRVLGATVPVVSRDHGAGSLAFSPQSTHSPYTRGGSCDTPCTREEIAQRSDIAKDTILRTVEPELELRTGPVPTATHPRGLHSLAPCWVP